MSFVSTPLTISASELTKKKFSWSPSQYKKIQLLNENFFSIKQLLVDSKLPYGREVGSLAYLRFPTLNKFIKTKAIQEQRFHANFSGVGCFEYISPKIFDLNKGENSSHVLKKNDLLFVTGGNVGEVALVYEDSGNFIASSHIIRIPVAKNRFYVFAFLKNLFGKEQANFGPVGSIAGLDSFNEETLLDIKIPFPSQKNRDEVIRYIESLVKITLEKEIILERKNNDLINKINQELLSGQGPRKFKYTTPSISDIKSLKRFDTGIYSEEYQKLRFLIENYHRGASSFADLGFKKISRGQNLQVTSIGRSYYSKVAKPGFYSLILSKDFSDWMTAEQFSYLGNPKKLKEVKRGDVIFSCRGDLGRVAVFCEEVDKIITNIDNAHIVHEKGDLVGSIFVASFLSFLRKHNFLNYISISGSGADSFTKYQFDLIKFPNFEQKFKKQIAKNYHNLVDYPNVSLVNLEERDAFWSNEAGIYELDKSLKSVKLKLDQLIEQIVANKEVDIDFTFLKI